MIESNRYVDHVLVRIGSAPASHYKGSLGILLGLADFGKPRVQPPDREILATIDVRCPDGVPLEPLILHRKGDNFSILPKSIVAVYASVNGEGNEIEMYEPCISDIFGHLAVFARTMHDVDLKLRFGGNPPLTFAFCRRGNYVMLNAEAAKPHIIA
ncbi:MAG: hypothetical protein Q7R85_01725 [bacterium]|nr:hypothetical protein [bacterium]